MAARLLEGGAPEAASAVEDLAGVASDVADAASASSDVASAADDAAAADSAASDAGSDAGDAATTCANSFSADTQVATDKGEQAISSLKVGDKVLAYDPKTTRVELKAIDAALVHHDLTLEDLTIDGEIVHTTPNHPFYTQDKGWVATENRSRLTILYAILPKRCIQKSFNRSYSPMGVKLRCFQIFME